MTKAIGTRIAATVLLGLVLVVAPTAFGGKGGNGGKPSGGGSSGSYTVTIDQPAPYVLGQWITVTTNTPCIPTAPVQFIAVQCFQGDLKVLDVLHAGFPGGWYYDMPFALGPTQMWTGGAASCKVWVYHVSNNRLSTDAVTYFNVSG